MQQPAGQFVYVNGGVPLQPAQPNMVAVPQGGQPQQQQYLVVMPAQQQQTVSSQYANYKKGTSRVMGAMQIVMGVLLIAINIGIAVISYNYVWVMSTGWWATPFYILAGSFGIAAGHRPNSCTVITTMVLSIFSCLTTASILAQGALGLAFGRCYDWSCGAYDTQEAHIALTSVFILLGIGEFAFGLTQAIGCCQASCGKPTNQVAASPQNHINGGFVPCYVNAQVPVQNTPGQPIGQMVQLQQGGTSMQNVPTITAQTGGATAETAGFQPPPYSKGQVAAVNATF